MDKLDSSNILLNNNNNNNKYNNKILITNSNKFPLNKWACSSNLNNPSINNNKIKCSIHNSNNSQDFLLMLNFIILTLNSNNNLDLINFILNFKVKMDLWVLKVMLSQICKINNNNYNNNNNNLETISILTNNNNSWEEDFKLQMGKEHLICIRLCKVNNNTSNNNNNNSNSLKYNLNNLLVLINSINNKLLTITICKIFKVKMLQREKVKGLLHLLIQTP